jgi:hypothetical protein
MPDWGGVLRTLRIARPAPVPQHPAAPPEPRHPAAPARSLRLPDAEALRAGLAGATGVAAVLRDDVWRDPYRPRWPRSAAEHRQRLVELVELMRQLLEIDGLDRTPLGNLVMFHQRTAEFRDGTAWRVALEDRRKAEEIVAYCGRSSTFLRALLESPTRS